jgi:hypothetical protein
MYYSKLTVTVQILRHNDQEEDEELDALSKAALQQLAISWLPSVSIEPLLQGLETVLILFH